MTGLLARTLLGYAQLVGVMGVLLFGGAGTFNFWQAWAYSFVFFVSAGVITAYVWTTDRMLLERRVRAGPTAEKEINQRWIQLFAGLAFVGLLVAPALDRRFSWSAVPRPVVMFGDILVVLGFLIVFLVFRQNTFAAATIEVVADQKVVSTGPYAVVRHPMYSGALVMLFGTPLALGSWWGLIAFIPMVLVLAWRLIEEERFLDEHLPGYADYRRQVRRRLAPLVW